MSLAHDLPRRPVHFTSSRRTVRSVDRCLHPGVRLSGWPVRCASTPHQHRINTDVPASEDRYRMVTGYKTGIEIWTSVQGAATRMMRTLGLSACEARRSGATQSRAAEGCAWAGCGSRTIRRRRNGE
eukprot:5915791-Prymnesium_polylepis.1